MGGWRDGFRWAYMEPDPERDGPGLVWRETTANHWSGSWGGQPRGAVMLESGRRWLAWIQLEEPPGLSPITTVGRFATMEEAMVATDEAWASR